MFFFFKQKTAYEMRISDWSSDVCFSDLKIVNHYSFYAAFSSEEEFRIVSGSKTLGTLPVTQALIVGQRILFAGKTWRVESIDDEQKAIRSEEHTSELQSLMRISYAVFCLQKKNQQKFT